MNLSKYPHVVQKEILNMLYADLFLLSFVSKKMKKLIKSSQMKRFQSIRSIIYRCNQQAINGKWEEQEVYIPFVNDVNKREHQTLMRTSEREEVQNDCFQLNVAGKMIDFRLRKQFGEYFPEACFNPCNKDVVIKAIPNYFLDFFGDSMEYRWMTNVHEQPVPELPNLSLCTNLWLDEEFGDMEVIENLLSSSPVFKEICVVDKSEKLFNLESKLYQTESLKIRQYWLTNHDYLDNFQGRQAFFYCDESESSDYIEFVNRWKSGEVYQKLEYLKIRIFEDERPKDAILNGIGAKYIDATKQPPTHSLPKVHIEWVDENPNTDPIISHTYVVRESDNRVASVLIQRETFSFGVWSKTEEEFLRMLE